jgi:PhoPQ-activated pathogenicity-related protein
MLPRLLLFIALALPAFAGPLEDYIAKGDSAFAWREKSRLKTNGVTLARLEMTSQQWRENPWTHSLAVVVPDEIRNPQFAFLFITGSGDGMNNAPMLRTIATRAGCIAAVITDVPNQPLYDGKREDALIAYTISEYLRTKDATWPLLFPMVKSAVRGLDTLAAFAATNGSGRVEKFIVSGASKRGWTTWLTAAADKRVAAIAPMVIDVLNMPEQIAWQRKVYGRDSEQIKDYTERGLTDIFSKPEMAELRGWIDPYSYRALYTMPKLILLGSNDPYWTVDSLRLYWNDLPGPKLIHQTPNAGHDLNGGREAIPTLATWTQMIADGETLPEMKWTFTDGTPAKFEATASQPIGRALFWTATSTNRDFRRSRWSSRPLTPEDNRVVGSGSAPTNGWAAGLIQAEFTSQRGNKAWFCTESKVTPDNPKPDRR